MESLGVYISVPFCRSKCTYCNFSSGVFSAGYHERYIERIIGHLRSSKQVLSDFGAKVPKVVDSVYLGGGTPSILPPELLRRLFRELRAEFDVTQTAEITIECAPGQTTGDFLAAMVDCEVNRVSFGVQSFIDREAAVTGRLHNREIALRDIDRVREAGIRSVNVDLIAGLPYQTAESWKESLEVLVSTGVDHASIYMLEVDEDSRLGREMLGGGGRYHAGSTPSDERVADFYLEAIAVLRNAGLNQYEISNFAGNGTRSVHNRKYWLRQPYLGFGVDAHSMLPMMDGGAVRFRIEEQLANFLNGYGWQDLEPLSRQQRLEEAWFLGLRLNDGVSLSELEEEFGRAQADRYDGLIDDLRSQGLVERECDRVRLTECGRLLSNEVFERFLIGSLASEHELVSVV